MTKKTNPLKAIALLALISATMTVATPAMAFDAVAADAALRQNGCFKCHAIDKIKDGPSYKGVAAKYKGKAGAEQRLITHITSGEIAKFPDGHEEEHKIIKTKDLADIKNAIQWILSL